MSLWTAVAEQWAQQSGDRVFTDLGYEPNCLPRHEARQAGVAEEQLPAPCGRCPQEQFHAATEYDVLYGGAAGGGKTKALLMEGIRACIRYPGITAGAIRRSYPELEESLLSELRPMLGHLADHYGARYDEAKHDLWFPSRSRIRFRHMGNLRDATKRQGGEYQLLLYDERTLTPPDAVDFLNSRLRSGRADLPVLGIRSGTNPGGIGHGRVKQDYIDATGHGQHVVIDERGRTRRFIQARVEDNPHLNPEYAQDLTALPEAMRKAFLDGDWDSFTGQVFTEWRFDRHVIDRETMALVVAHATAAAKPRYSGLDWGWTAPWVYLTAQVDHDGRLWVFRELDGRKLTDEQQAAQVKDAEGLDVSARFADPAMWAGTGAGLTQAESYAKAGVQLQKANNARIPGWQRVHAVLQEGPACIVHRRRGWDTCPMLHVSTACADLIRTLPALPYDPVHIEDVDTNADDHWADALRYLVMGVGTVPPSPPGGRPSRSAATETADLATVSH